MFGKRFGEYLAFQKLALGVLAAVGLTRLGLSLAGVPNSIVLWFSMNIVLWAATAYHAVVVHTTGFGSYKQLLALTIQKVILFQAIAVFGILLSIAGFGNIYAAPEYSGPFVPVNQWIHVLAHLTIGVVLATLLLWAIGSLIMLVTKRVNRRPAVA